MIIKKFQAKTESDAVAEAKKELGTGIVIMNVRSIKKKGLLGFLRPQMTEVTVALEEESERIRLAAKNGSIPESKQPKTPPPRTVRPLVPQIIPEDTPAPNNAIIYEPPPGTSRTTKKSTVLEDKIDSLQILLEQQLAKPEEEKSENGDKEEMTELLIFLRLLYNKMIDNEIYEVYANQIIDEVDKNNKPNIPLDHALSNIYQRMILKFGKPATITCAENEPKVIFFVGPTGVGKTTTIAKIASRFRVDEQKKVALLTTDTYRIAAAEQLKTYANILEVPFRVIYAKEEMTQAIGEFRDYDLIIVDTAGHSHQNKSQKKSIAEFVEAVAQVVPTEVYLVVSATTKYRDLKSIADSYKNMADFKLIFTKLDETATLGNVLNLKLYTGASLSYMTYGQNVPDDIEVFNPQKTVKMLLGGKI
ncbi:MAG: flagellar biosynthesis protein FlhF [Lachnospiraceae bacterium]|jgi:flagellar biosynthesis protein FlhF|nr:flagellar biosynthesis protein FlhF [Lachnospiraceae bacterium]